MSIDPAWIALAGTVFGGVGLKTIEYWLGRNRYKISDAQQIRDELRIEINSQKEEIRQLEEDVNKWREEYYNLRDKYVALQTELSFALQRIKDEAAAAEKKTVSLQSKPPVTPPVDNLGPSV